MASAADREFVQQLDTLYTTTWYDIRDGVADNVFKSMAFYFWLQSKGRIKPQTGGRFIETDLEYSKNEQAKWIGKGETTSLNDYEFLTVAQYDWKFLTIPIVRFFQDELKNRGRNRIINMVEQKLKNTKNSMTEELNSVLVTSGSDNSKKMNGLRDIVADDPTTGTLGGINSATYDWWRNKTKSMTGNSFATNGISEMRKMLFAVTDTMETQRPDIIISGEDPYGYYEDEVILQKRIVNQKLADAGFDNIEYKGIPIIMVRGVEDRMYFLNTEYMEMFYDPMAYFSMTEWKAIPQQVNDRVAQIILGGNLTTNRRLVHGVMHSIDTP
jgi:hypothetical protein